MTSISPSSTRLLVFTGAGISADSGIATFRDKNGLWERHDVKDVCSMATWKANFTLVHRFYNQRRVQLGEAQPNPAHRMLVRLQATYDATIITQNIDDLLERAGCRDVVHVHGRLTQLRCTACGHGPWDVGYTAWDETEQRCPSCLSRRGVKPNVVFFGEAAPLYATMVRAIHAQRPGDVLLVMGTSGQVVSIGEFAEQSQATSILSNLAPEVPDEYGQTFVCDTSFDHALHGRAAERAPEIEALVASLLDQPTSD